MPQRIPLSAVRLNRIQELDLAAFPAPTGGFWATKTGFFPCRQGKWGLVPGHGMKPSLIEEFRSKGGNHGHRILAAGGEQRDRSAGAERAVEPGVGQRCDRRDVARARHSLYRAQS